MTAPEISLMSCMYWVLIFPEFLETIIDCLEAEDEAGFGLLAFIRDSCEKVGEGYGIGS